jgi:hypothetical protein
MKNLLAGLAALTVGHLSAATAAEVNLAGIQEVGITFTVPAGFKAVGFSYQSDLLYNLDIGGTYDGSGCYGAEYDCFLAVQESVIAYGESLGQSVVNTVNFFNTGPLPSGPLSFPLSGPLAVAGYVEIPPSLLSYGIGSVSLTLGYQVFGFIDGSRDARITGDYATASAAFAPVQIIVYYESSAVPEPAIWLTMLTGFAAVGGVLRSRRRAAFQSDKARFSAVSGRVSYRSYGRFAQAGDQDRDCQPIAAHFARGHRRRH